MISDVKIYDPGFGKRGYVELYVEGERHRIWSGKQLGIRCNPNSLKNTEPQRKKLFLKLALEAQAYFKANSSKQNISTSPLSNLVNQVIDNFGASYSLHYLKDIKAVGGYFIEHLERFGLSKQTAAQFKACDIQRFLSSYEFSASSYMTVRSKLSAIFGKLVKLGHLSTNIVIDTSRRRVKPVLHEAYTQEQIIPLLKYLEVHYPNLYLCALLMYGCFLRPHEEIRLLKRSHFDISLDTIRLSGLENKGGKIRIVPVPDYVKTELNRRNVKVSPSDKFLFGGEFRSFNRYYFSTMWARAKPELLRLKLIKPKQTVYSFRHSAAINVFEASQKIKLLQQLLGHQSVVTTELYLRSIGQIAIDVDMMPRLPVELK